MMICKIEPLDLVESADQQHTFPFQGLDKLAYLPRSSSSLMDRASDRCYGGRKFDSCLGL